MNEDVNITEFPWPFQNFWKKRSLLSIYIFFKDFFRLEINHFKIPWLFQVFPWLYKACTIFVLPPPLHFKTQEKEGDNYFSFSFHIKNKGPPPSPFPGPANPLPLHQVGALPEAGGVTQQDGEAADVQRRLHDVSGGAGDGRNDGCRSLAWGSQERGFLGYIIVCS